ncbi:MAG: hypothetical protein M4D80_09765 [Myxococcota bacterium]|nr:hypothetical protein [Myxococcota bacterium]
MTKKLLIGLASLPIAYGAYKLYKSRQAAAVQGAKPVAAPVAARVTAPVAELIPTLDALPPIPPPRSVKSTRKQPTTAPRRARRPSKKKA